MDYGFDYGIEYNSQAQATEMLKNYLLGAYTSALIVSLVVALIVLIEDWKIFKKCGKPGWATLVPIYNIWVFLQCAGMPGWLSIIPIVNIFAMLIAMFKLPKQFGKSGAFGLGILFFSPIFLGILAFGKSSPNNNENTPVQAGPDLMATDPNAGGNVNLMTPDPVATMPDSSSAVQPIEFTEQQGLDNQLNTAPTPQENNSFVTEEQTPSEPTNAFEMQPPVTEVPVQEQPVETIPTIEEQVPEVANETPVNAFEMQPPVTEVPVQEPVESLNLNNPEIEIPAVAPLEEKSNFEREIPTTNENIQTPEPVQNINEAVNANITETKKCAFCGFENPYTNKTCEKCGQVLN